jgi:hypothetical protein
MKTIEQMKETVKQFLLDNGFEQDNYFLGCDNYHFPGKVEIIKGTRFNTFTMTEMPDNKYVGRCITVKVVYRSNGTEANQSIEILITDWDGSSGRRVFREKLYARHGEKKTASVLANVLEAYHS